MPSWSGENLRIRSPFAALGTLEDTIGGRGPNVNEDTVQQVHTYLAELRQLTPEALALYDAERIEVAKERRLREEEEGKRFFNQPKATADYSHWCRASYWTLDEATALSFGKDPRRVSWKRLEPYGKPTWARAPSPFARRYEDLRDLIHRAKVMGQLHDPVHPGLFVVWARGMKVDLPAELLEGVQVFGHQFADWKSLYEQVKSKNDALAEQFATATAELSAAIEQNKALSEVAPKGLKTRERETVLKLIIGMAVKGYGFDPSASRSEHIADIANDLDSVGLHLDVDTVRKWLKEAAELLPPNESGKSR